MRKTILILIFCTMLLLTACDGLSTENRDCAQSVLEVADHYLDGKIAASTALSALELYKSCVVHGKNSDALISRITAISDAILTGNDPASICAARNAVAGLANAQIR